MKVLISEFDRDYPHCNEWIQELECEEDLEELRKELSKNVGFSYQFKVVND